MSEAISYVGLNNIYLSGALSSFSAMALIDLRL